MSAEGHRNRVASRYEMSSFVVSRLLQTLALASSGEILEQLGKVVGMLLFHRLDFLDHAPCRSVEGRKIRRDLAITVDCDALGDQVFFDHVDQVLALDVFGMAARRSEEHTSELQSPM